MSENTYNGWSNYATWRVNLEVIDDYVSSLVGEGPQWADVRECRSALESYIEELFDQIGATGLVLDYANAFVSDVNWYEIAEAIQADNPELFEDSDEDDDDES